MKTVTYRRRTLLLAAPLCAAMACTAMACTAMFGMISALAGSAYAEDQDGGQGAGDTGFPPPQVAPTRAETAADDDADWSRPSTPPVSQPPITAGGAVKNGRLPPPQIVRHSRRVPARTPYASTAATAPIARDVPAARLSSVSPIMSPVAAPSGAQAAAPLVVPTTPDSRRLQVRATRVRVNQPTCRILSIQKTHNVEAPDGVGDVLFLQLDVEYEVRGQQGRDVYIGTWFARSADGRLVRSLRQRYADTAGNATIQTRWTRVTGATARYAATLLIPYQVFPAHESGKSYEIDARVQLLRNEARGRVSLLARDKTMFRVYGLSEEEQEPTRAPSDGLDRRGFAMPGEGGEIIEPGIPTGIGAKDVAGEQGTILTPGRQDGSGAKDTPGESGAIDDVSK